MHANYREKVINDDKISSFDVKNRDFAIIQPCVQ